MKKSLLAIFLALVLAASFSACGKKKSEDATEPSEETTAATEEATEETTEPESGTEEDTKPQSGEKATEKPAAKPEQPTEKTTEASANVDLSKVRSEIIDKLQITDAMMIETSSLLNLYGIEASQVKQSSSFVTPSGVFPHEIVMIEAVSESAANDISDLLQSRLSEVLVQSETYDAENYEIAQQCKVLKNKNFVALFLSPDQSRMTAIYKNYVKD